MDVSVNAITGGQGITIVGLLLAAVGGLWAYLVKLQGDYNRTIQQKDVKIEEVTNKFIDMVEKQVRVNEQLNSTLQNNTRAVDANTQLSNKIYETLIVGERQ